MKVSGKDHNRIQISNNNGSLRIASNQKVRNRSIEIFCPENLSFQKIKLQMGAGTIELDGDFKAEQPHTRTQLKLARLQDSRRYFWTSGVILE